MSWKTASQALALAGLFAGVGSCMPDYTFVPCGDGLHPTICIVDPVDEGNVTLGGPGDPGIDVHVVVSNFTIRMPNTCGAIPRCGHIHLVVEDINAGDDPAHAIPCTPLLAGGQPYTVAGFGAVIPLHFGACRDAGASPLGMHRITAFLRADDHTEAPGEVIDSIIVNVQP